MCIRDRNNVWEAVRGVWMLIENIDNVPGLGEDEDVYKRQVLPVLPFLVVTKITPLAPREP